MSYSIVVFPFYNIGYALALSALVHSYPHSLPHLLNIPSRSLAVSTVHTQELNTPALLEYLTFLRRTVRVHHQYRSQLRTPRRRRQVKGVYARVSTMTSQSSTRVSFIYPPILLVSDL